MFGQDVSGAMGGYALLFGDQDCPSEADKVAGKGTFYNFLFSQWNLPVLQVGVYEGSCKLIQNNATGQTYQGDQEFWNLVHRAPNQ